MASDLPPYPPIEPTTFDLIVLGTGLPASIIAAAASTVGKSVLHLDPNAFYGSHFASLPLHELSSFLQSHHATADAPSTSLPHGGDLATSSTYSFVEISSYSPEPMELSRKFSLDLAGPRVLFCADPAVDLMMRSGASQYMEFKGVDASFVRGPDGEFWSVPDSRAAIFKDRSLSLTEKNQLMRFFKMVQQHLSSSDDASDSISGTSSKISEEDLESPFVEFLSKMRLPSKIKSAILYAIVMAGYDQNDPDCGSHLLKTRNGIDRLALYQSSVGRFQNAPGALLYPIYGQGELPQAFCRRSAVKGCLYVLRMPVTALLQDQGSNHYKGVKLSTGQDIFSEKLVVDPSFTLPLPLDSDSPKIMQESFTRKGSKTKVARAICITRSSLKPDGSNFLVVYPPKSLYPEQVTAIRALQIGSNLSVCPIGMFVSYLSALCDDIDQGKNLLYMAMNSLFTHAVAGDTDVSSSPEDKDTGEAKPILLWSAVYIQELNMLQSSSDCICSSALPDADLDYTNTLKETEKLFHKLYPDEEFFPKTPLSEDINDLES